MNELFDTALSIANGVARYFNMQLTSLAYSPVSSQFTAYFADEKGHSWVYIRKADLDILTGETKANYELDTPETA